MSMAKVSILSKTTLACAFVGVAFCVIAKEAPIGMISFAQGNVSVGGNGFVSKATRGTVLMNGSVVMVSTNGRATLKLNEGCSVGLSGGQHVTVDAKLSCDELQASVTQMFAPYQVAQSGGTVGGGAAGGANLGVVAVMAGVSVLGFAAVKNDEKGSGS